MVIFLDSPHLILAAAGFSKVGNWRELCVDGLSVEPAVIQVHDGFLCILLTTKLHTVEMEGKVKPIKNKTKKPSKLNFSW